MRKFWAYLRLTFIEAFTYRATGFIWMLNDSIPALVAMLFWSAAFSGRELINGYSLAEMQFYYLGVMLIDSLVFAYPEYSLIEEIRSGTFSKYLIKPFNLVVFKMFDSIVWRLIRLVFFLPLSLVIIYLFFSGFSWPVLVWWQVALFVVGLIFAFLIIFFMKMVFGLLAIWWTEIGWLLFSFDIVTALFSGELIPLDFLPPLLVNINNWLPFKYFIYFPLAIGLNQITRPEELIFGFGVAGFWLIFFFGLYRLLFKIGLKNYSAYGG